MSEKPPQKPVVENDLGKSEQSKSISFLRSERIQRRAKGYSRENFLLIVFLAGSVLAHAFVFYAKPEINRIELSREQEAVEVDLYNFLLDPPAIKKKVVAIKDKKVTPVAAIPKNLLPQLAKKTKVEEAEKVKESEDSVAIKAEKEKIAQAAEEAKKEKKKKEAEDKKKKLAEAKKQKKEEDKANKIKKAELQKRLALEKLRKSEDVQKGKELTVQSDKQNKIDQEALKLKQAEVAAQREEAKAPCTKFIKQFVEPMLDEQLPVKYKFGKTIAVIFLISPEEDLSIGKIEMEATSGDDYFDEIAEKALLASAPLPDPCRPFVGTKIRIRFPSSS